jgi:hypothetical protein
MNAERILIASEAIGDGRWFTEKAPKYASERTVFDQPIGRNQGVQFPIARAYASIEAASLMARKAGALFEAGKPCGPEANMAKLLSSEASWQAGEAALQTHGGFGFATEYDIERKWRETRLFQVAPISTNHPRIPCGTVTRHAALLLKRQQIGRKNCIKVPDLVKFLQNFPVARNLDSRGEFAVDCVHHHAFLKVLNRHFSRDTVFKFNALGESA